MKKILSLFFISPEHFITQLSTQLDCLGTGYFGDPASLKEHSYQAGRAAVLYYKTLGISPNPEVIAASFLHDLGHIAANLFLIQQGILKTITDYSITHANGLDDKHEEIIGDLLKGYFSDHVCALVRSHVVAKKVLCNDVAYKNALTTGSSQSLSVQETSLSEKTIETFKLSSYFNDATLLRTFDEDAKDPTRPVTDDEQATVLQHIQTTLLPVSFDAPFPFTIDRMISVASKYLPSSLSVTTSFPT